MKPRRHENYGVSARPYTLEQDGSAELWGDAYWLKLNDAVTIKFLPELPHVVEELKCPDDIDEPTTRADAMAILALGAQHVITPNDARAGTSVKLQPTDLNNESIAAVFFVTRDEYARAIAELARIHEVTVGASPAAHFRDEFTNGFVIPLVERELFPSPNLSSYARSVLPVPDERSNGS